MKHTFKRQEIAFRITKIGKTTVSAAFCGLAMVACQSAFATNYNLASSNSVSILTTTDSAAISYLVPGFGSNTLGGSTLGINLAAGVNLIGQSGLAAFTYSSPDGLSTDNVYFSGNTSSFTLNGNNQITGAVGVHFNNASSASADPFSLISVQNAGNVFNNQVYANNINLNSGSTIQFLGDIGDGSNSTNLNYLGSNSIVTLGNNVTLHGNVTNTAISNSQLIFNGNGTVTGSVGSNTTGIGTVQVNGNGALVQVNGNLSTDHLEYQATSTVAVGGDLYLNVNNANNAVNTVTFGNTNGTLQVGGNIVGVAGKAAVTTAVNNTGTVTMVSGNQSIVGNIGTNGLAIGTLNIGGNGSAGGIDTNPDATSNTTVYGNIFAQTVRLNNDNTNPTASSTLTLANDSNLTGNVVTDGNGLGNLTLAGGTQTVTGPVGASGVALNAVTSGATGATSTFTGPIYATDVENSGSGMSNYQGTVTANSVGVNNGTSNFQQSLIATTTTIGAGTGNFNTLGGSTTSNIRFSDAGTANLNQGLTGSVNFAGYDGVVNLSDTKSISGALTTTTNNTGIVNALGGGTLSSTVGAAGLSIKELNIDRNTAGANGDTTGVTKTVAASADIFASSVKLFNDGRLQLADAANMTGVVTTTTNNTGSLSLLGASTVTGNVGAAGTALKSIDAATTGKTATFTNGVVYATSLNYTGDGTVQFNGSSNKVATVVTNGALTSGGGNLGFVGTVDFGTNSTNIGTFRLGDNVDLVTQHASSPAANTQTTFVDANGATLSFAGSSVVSGQLGSGPVPNGSAIGNDTFRSIYAGANGSTVTFLNDLYVSGTTFHVSGAGTVNFVGDMNGPLVYDGNGSVNVADGKSINGTVTTATSNTGTLNLVGSTTTRGSIGTSSAFLEAVNFHAASSDSTALPVTPGEATANIGNDVYAMTTSIGAHTTANITSNVFLGNTVTLADSTVTLNTAGGVRATDAISPVNFDNVKNANGILSNSAAVTQSTFGKGALTTSGATLNFAIGTSDWAANAGGTVNVATSSRITGGTGSTLVMNGKETVNLSLLGSLRNGQSYTVVDVAGGVSTGSGNTSVPTTQNVKDNSFVIDTALTRTNGESGNLVVTATRADDVYITKSNTAGHFSNPAALRLGTLAAAGTGYGSDLQTVLNKLDIDQWGFGNNQANLAVQAQRLAPIANNSLGLSALRAASTVNDSIGMRMQELRASETKKPFDNASIWVRTLYQDGRQTALNGYDGYGAKSTGLTLGADSHLNVDSIVGAALTYNNTTVEQKDFRSGDAATLNGLHLSLFGSYDFTPELFVDGSLSMGRFNTLSNRSTAVGRVAQADFESTQVSGKVDLGYRIKLDSSSSTLTPMVSMERSNLKQQAYSETGAGDIGLNVDQQNLSRTQASLGLRLATSTMWGAMVVKPALSVMVTRDSGNFAKPVDARFIGDASQATFRTLVPKESAYGLSGYRANLGVAMLMSETSTLMMRYDYSKGAGYASTGVELTGRWDF